MIAIISAGIAPGLALLSYFYLRDERHTEPISLVLKTFISGAMLVLPLMFIQYVVVEEQLVSNIFSQAFLSSALLEEFFKWFILFYVVYKHAEFDEHYDGIVYATSVSLGFATVENILYLLSNGVEFAIGRAIFPVSSHALFGVVMGYYVGKAKFSHQHKSYWLLLSIVLPFTLHGIFNSILLTKQNWGVFLLPFMIFLWWFGLRKVKSARLQTHQLELFNRPSLKG
ncbi:PrsW family intramembrane metalloprotease [Bacillus sp. HMF5848]|uniref:glutamic-type intramembrane protease PrsW n=1 Tax=Bacillus sp. HMF5848 TaxID=2495421 RepID=UPI000F767F5B|nr:glutamic-type intramembrane protease PrsW [Bacillus sp. HMF5848]RSK27455.1 PrsW family intramembrane metalloprotease [Bacillus sp. HMF5848]